MICKAMKISKIRIQSAALLLTAAVLAGGPGTDLLSLQAYAQENAEIAETASDSTNNTAGSENTAGVLEEGPQDLPAPAPDGGIVRIQSLEDYHAFCRNCRYDDWSEGKTVYLDTDLTFKPGESEIIESFGGTFEGQGHTISGFVVDGYDARTGLFGTIRENAVVRGLNVSGAVKPSGIQTRLGGIAGSNYGLIEDCAFNGTVSAHAEVGGIAGRNMQSGEIRSCTAEGSVQGDSFTGGIAGYNEGVITSCQNGAMINTVYSDVPFTTDQLTSTIENILMTGKLNNPENLDARTDTGGIAGISSGMITSCINTGDIGYEHVGYNTGGIVGRSSGYIRDCANEGLILGRKDVGGIAGQLQPFLEMDFSESLLGDLDDKLDILDGQIGSAINSAEYYSSDTNARLGRLSSLAGSAKDSIKVLTDEADAASVRAAGKVNAAGQTVQDSLSVLSGVTREIGNYIRDMEDQVSALEQRIDILLNDASLSDSDREALRSALKKFREGLNLLSSANGKLGDVVIDGPEIDESRTKDVTDAYRDIRSGYRMMSEAAQEIQSVLGIRTEGGAAAGDSQFYRDARLVREAAGEMLRQIEEEEDGLLTIVRERTRDMDQPKDDSSKDDSSKDDSSKDSSFDDSTQDDPSKEKKDTEGEEQKDPDAPTAGELSRVIGIVESAQEGIEKIVYGRGEGSQSLSQELEDYISSTEDSEEPLSEDDKSRLRNDVTEIENACIRIDSAVDRLKGIRDEALQNGDAVKEWMDKAVPVISEIAGDLNTIVTAFADISRIVSGYVISLPSLDDSGIRGAFRSLIHKAGAMPDIDRDLSGVMDRLAGMDIRISGVSDTARSAGNQLYDTMNSMMREVNGLNASMGEQSTEAFGEIRGITDQFDSIIGTLEEIAKQQMGGDDSPEDRIQDVSDEEIESSTSGRTSECRNTGRVEADSSVGGIVGTIGVEYDLDPEQDIRRIGGTSLDYIFRAKCIVDRSENEGTIVSRNNYCGGIVGNMQMGVVSACDSLCTVSSDGDYTGGIAGYCASGIQDCRVKAEVKGTSYVGGVAGYAQKLFRNAAMINVTGARQFYGAIAGDVEENEGSRVSDNVYYSDTAYGINGVSYRSAAEEITYDAIREYGGSHSGAGTEGFFDALKIQFTDGDNIVDTVYCVYGDSIPESRIPAVPEKEGFKGNWSRTDFSYIERDETVLAKYTRFVTLIAAQKKRESGLDILQAEGRFDDSSELILLGEAPEDDELERWNVTVPESVSPSPVTLRYLPPQDANNVVIYCMEDGVLTEVPAAANGKYITFPAKSGNLTFSVKQKDNDWKKYLPILPAAGAGLAAVLTLTAALKASRRRRRHRHRKAN